MSAAGKTLVVGPAWVGDMVMAQSLYKLLRRRAPERGIDVVAPSWTLPLLARMPEVDRGIELDAGHGELALGRRYALGRRLRGEGYTHALVLPRSLKAALVPFFAAIPRRTGYLGEMRYGLINDRRPFDPVRLDQTVKRFVALGCEPDEALPDPLDPPALEPSPERLAALRARFGLGGESEAVALMPGAEYGPAKRWPAERFSRLAARLAERGVDVWIVGSARERPIGETIVSGAGAPRVHNLCGDTALEDVVDLLAAAKAAVTNDSGLMHVAAAVGTHVVAIFGSSSPDFTPPLTHRRTIIRRGLPCSPCFERECPLGHLRCLREIPVDEVFDAALDALGPRGDHRGGGDDERRAAHD